MDKKKILVFKTSKRVYSGFFFFFFFERIIPQKVIIPTFLVLRNRVFKSRFQYWYNSCALWSSSLNRILQRYLLTFNVHRMRVVRIQMKRDAHVSTNSIGIQSYIFIVLSASRREYITHRFHRQFRYARTRTHHKIIRNTLLN